MIVGYNSIEIKLVRDVELGIGFVICRQHVP